MSKIIVLMGAPGAGKGTQARLLQEHLSITQISTGDMLRARALEQDVLAEEIRTVQSSGKLASDDLVMRVVQERTAREDSANGYVLDGFPRTMAQATMLENLAAQQGHKIVAIVVDVPFNLLEKRATGRLSCPVCGEIYNTFSKPPKNDKKCDYHPHTKLVQRVDDTAEKIKIRLETYNEQTKPLIDYYDSTGRLHRIDGTKKQDEIHKEIEGKIRPNGFADDHQGSVDHA
ncbi:MAG: nucleoside monophosphate kinase [Acidobacteriota bacterium]|nr:nucleoside monophosphate kinase [Acidobacteriota bacterium]